GFFDVSAGFGGAGNDYNDSNLTKASITWFHATTKEEGKTPFGFYFGYDNMNISKLKDTLLDTEVSENNLKLMLGFPFALGEEKRFIVAPLLGYSYNKLTIDNTIYKYSLKLSTLAYGVNTMYEYNNAFLNFNLIAYRGTMNKDTPKEETNTYLDTKLKIGYKFNNGFLIDGTLMHAKNFMYKSYTGFMLGIGYSY
ncbi:hypothetical protein, partial [Campylobacter canadensis]